MPRPCASGCRAWATGTCLGQPTCWPRFIADDAAGCDLVGGAVEGLPTHTFPTDDGGVDINDLGQFAVNGSGRAFLYDGTSGGHTTAPIPDDMEALEHQVHDNLVEGIVVADDAPLADHVAGYFGRTP